ncbi:hypothetical protein Gpo141_00007170 [Globisporangium polare]
MNSLGLAAYGSSSEDEDAEPNHAATPATPLPQPSAGIVNLVAADSEDDELEAALARAGIPPESKDARVDADVQERIRKYIAAQSERSGFSSNGSSNGISTSSNFQASLRDKKDVKNPYILDKVVAYFGIDELQSNFDPQVFDPYAMPLHEYSDEIALAQKKQSEAREQAQLLGLASRQLQFARGAL